MHLGTGGCRLLIIRSIPSLWKVVTYLALYLQHITESTKSTAAAEEAVKAITWLHNAAGIPNPAENPFANHYDRRIKEDTS